MGHLGSKHIHASHQDASQNVNWTIGSKYHANINTFVASSLELNRLLEGQIINSHVEDKFHSTSQSPSLDGGNLHGQNRTCAVELCEEIE